MKILLCVLVLVALAHAKFEIDWSKLRRRDVNFPLPFLPKEFYPEKRIVGGQEAVPNSVPYQAALFIQTSEGLFFCGGTLISIRYILTAAHCVDDAIEVQIFLGAHNIQVPESSQVSFFSTNITVHESWNPDTLVNDIALVALPEEVQLNINVQIIPIPTYSLAGNSFAGVTATLSGWGIIFDDASSISDVLYVVVTEVIYNLICNLYFLGSIQGTHICTAGDNGVGACSGDSGGPIITGTVQIGIISFGSGLGCELGWPTGGTRLTYYLDWIQANSDVTIYP